MNAKIIDLKSFMIENPLLAYSGLLTINCLVLLIIFSKRYMLSAASMNFKTMPKFSIPDGVTEISKRFFWGAEIGELELPGQLKKIGENAFMDLHTNKLVIPPSVTKISNKCFFRAEIDEIVLPAKLQTIGERAFEYSTITNLIIPAAVTELPKRCFNEANIDKLLILNPKIEISNNAFAGFQGTIYTFGNDFKKFTDAGYKGNIVNLAEVEDAGLFVELCGDVLMATLKPIHDEFNIKCWKKVLPTIDIEFNKQRQQIVDVGLRILGYSGWTLNQLMHHKELKVHDTLNLFFTKVKNEGVVNSKEVADEQKSSL